MSSFFNTQPPASSLLHWLFQQQHSGISLGLGRMRELLAGLGNPQDRVPCFHIAGTNGKGSVSAFAASLLKAAELRVGLYTSPHLVDFRERIQINGKLISQEDLEEGLRRLQQVTQGWKTMPTFFELTTALAFDYFERQRCDVIILETGMGGRLDATNLSENKIACAMTSISLDHQEWLGSTLADIAREKAGIMRAGVPVVTTQQSVEVMSILKEEATRIGAPLSMINEALDQKIPLGLAGSYQRWNAALALKLIQQGPWKISREAQRIGFKTVSWPGRFQSMRLKVQACKLKVEEAQNQKNDADDSSALSNKTSINYEQPPANSNCLPHIAKGVEQLLILDGAHNPAAAKQLVTTWKEMFPGQKCDLIFGALLDKEGERMLRILEPITTSIILVPVHSPRTAFPAEFQKIFPLATTFSSLGEVFRKKIFFLDNALSFSESQKPPILLTGSLFLVGEALSIFQGRLHSSFLQ